MDRQIVYPGQSPADTDYLHMMKQAMVGLGNLAQTTIGTSTLFSGLACTPGTGLHVAIGQGAVYFQEEVDATAYGSLGADANLLVKQGLTTGATLSTPAPGTTGQSINYLIEAQYQDVDANPVVLPFYDSSDPSIPYTGPSNSGAPSNTTRKGLCAVQVKAGTAASTGSQTTPSPDGGWTGLWVVTVPYGASSIVTGDIAEVDGAPLISETLTQKISQATADARYALLSALATEISRAEAEEATIAGAISTEIARAEGIEGTLASEISAETARAEGVEATLNRKCVGNLSSGTGPWWTWNPETGEVHVHGQYRTTITSEGVITVSFPVNIGAFRSASATLYQNSGADASVGQIDSASPPTNTGMGIRIQDNQGGSGASATGFDWHAWGYSAVQPS